MTNELQNDIDSTESFDSEALATQEENLSVEADTNIRAGVVGYCYPHAELA